MTNAQCRLRPEVTAFSVESAAEAMITVNPTGHILSANRLARQRLEYTLDELLSMQIADINPSYPPELWPDHFSAVRRDGTMTIETQHRSKSGKLFDVEISIAYFKFEDHEYCCGTFRDISKQKQAEKLVELQSKVLSRIASSSDDLANTLTELCRIVEQMVPHTMASVMLIDQPDGKLRFRAGPHLTPEVEEAFGAVRPDECSGSCGAAAYLKRHVIVEDTRDSPHWSNITDIAERFGIRACWSIPILDEQKNVIGTFAISHTKVAKANPFQLSLLDTAANLASIATRRKNWEDQLQRAHVELDRFGRLSTIGEMASTISHELNQPLAAIVNDAFVMEMLAAADTPDHESIQAQARVIREQSMRAAEIVKSMRRLVGKTPPSRKRVSVEKIVADSLAFLKPDLQRNRLHVNVIHHGPAIAIDVDCVQIQQVLINLVRNAIEAITEAEASIDGTPSSDYIHITTRCENGNVTFLVEDCGPGVAADDLDDIFTPFHSSKTQGMGMGLAICRTIASAHGGRLTVQNRTPHGAAFLLSIPCPPCTPDLA